MEAKQPTEQDKKKDTGVIIGIGGGGGVVVLIIVGVLVARAVKKKKHLKSLNQTLHQIDSNRLENTGASRRATIRNPTLHLHPSAPFSTPQHPSTPLSTPVHVLSHWPQLAQSTQDILE